MMLRMALRRRATALPDLTYDLDSGSTALTIPSGYGHYEIWVKGAGAGGSWGGAAGGNAGMGAGGGEGGTAYKTGTVLSGEWGASLTRSVGAAGTGETTQTGNNATNGGNSTLTGTLGGVALNLVGTGGTATQDNNGGAGGIPTGGGTNTTGFPGDASDPGVAPGAGGFGAVDLGNTRGAGGGGGANAPGANGVGGRIRVKFTV